MDTKREHLDKIKIKENLDRLEKENFVTFEEKRATKEWIALKKEWDDVLEANLTFLDKQLEYTHDLCLKDSPIYENIQKYVDYLITTFREDYEKQLGLDYGAELHKMLIDKYISPYEDIVTTARLSSMEKEEDIERRHLETPYKDELNGLSASACLTAAMDCATKSKSTLRSRKKDKQTTLGEYFSAYKQAEGEQRQRALRAFIYAASEPRKTMFFQAKFGETASAAAFYNALTDDSARKMVSEALGLNTVLPMPTGKNLAVFADAVRNEFKNELEPTTTHLKK